MTDLLTKAKERMRTRSMYRYCQSPRFDSYCEGSGGEGGVEGRRGDGPSTQKYGYCSEKFLKSVCDHSQHREWQQR